MHSKEIVHRDLKHLNVFLSSSGSSPRIKIGDLDLACRLPYGKNSSIDLRGGTVPFFSPERVQNRPYGLKADIWSLGIILYSMLYGGVTPFESDSLDEIMKNIVRDEVCFDRLTR